MMDSMLSIVLSSKIRRIIIIIILSNVSSRLAIPLKEQDVSDPISHAGKRFSEISEWLL
jgi:hypothetical protein